MKRNLLLLITVLSFIAPCNAYATDSKPSVQNSEDSLVATSYYNEVLSGSAYIASPQELSEMGYSETAVHQQEKALRALPYIVRNQNNKLMKSQQNLTNEYRQQNIHGDFMHSTPNNSQTSLRSTYQVRSTTGEVFHFRQKGIFNVNILSAKTVSPGFGKGRALYQSLNSSVPTAKLWTNWRENTNQEFEMPYKTYYSSRLYPSIERIERYSLAQ